MKNSLHSRFIVVCLTWLLFPGLLLAESAIELFDTVVIQESLDAATQQLQEASSEDTIDIIRAQLPTIKTPITQCLAKTKTQIEQLNSDLKSIGESSVGDTELIINRREDLYTGLGRVKENNFSCKKLDGEYEKLLANITQKLRELTAQRLSQRSFSILESIEALPSSIPNMITKGQQAVNIGVPDKRRSFSTWIIGLLFAGIGIGIGFIIQLYTRKWLVGRKGPGGKPPYEFNLLNTLNIHIPWIVGGFTGFVAFEKLNLTGIDLNLPARLFLILAVFSIANFLFVWICKEHSPGDTLHTFDKQIPKALVKRLRFTAIITAVGFGIFGSQWLRQIPDLDLRLPYQVINIILAFSLFSVLLLARNFTDLKGRYRVIRLALLLPISVAIIATLAGYLNAANYLLFALLTTIIAVLLLWILLWSLEESINGIIVGKAKTSYKLRASLGIRANETSRELGWLRLLIGLALWTAFAILLLIVWDFTDSSIPTMKHLATDGFSIGDDTRIVPGNILNGLTVFAVILSISVWLKAKLERKWLRNIGMERGSRDAVVTLTGYLGMILAVLLGLTAAGVSFAGLALVAGALSVGIGFGLQNIVNNFISGLILLFERPIHTGDYISVGTVEGKVKRISIRSTEIETRQRTSVIVPNSELISGQVTNWVLHDAYGQIQIPVGVAYGSDTELVKKLLLEVAHEHPEVMTRPNLQQPLIRFLGFGDSSLNFTIVVLVKNIDHRFDIISDMNFAIDLKLRENNIEIPFPQRDLHIRSHFDQKPTVMPEFLKPKMETSEDSPLEDKQKTEPDHD